MLFCGVLASTLLLAAGIHAQIDDEVIAEWAPMKRQSPDDMVTVYTVQVGSSEGSQRFYPDSLVAEPGSMVQFQFHPANHSVVQSTFENPCSPIDGGTGIRSGFLAVSPDSETMPVFTIMINDSSPVWLFCGQKNHCQNGMVMVINPPEAQDRGIEAFRTLAMTGKAEPSGGGPTTLPTGGAFPTGSNRGGIARPSGGFLPSKVATGSPTPTEGGDPFSATFNAAPKQMSHTAGVFGLLLAAFAIIGL
ncbi:hypothetical protein AJ78_00478 [Emergomyces pasteurianus Ep9510]|uniref:Phytocyanin domain-containing protein n=1 Tax=Emergomyces pasteurianus Ep9510 TaxID=1447872 RepID=A0A1J9QWE0_9EURO|nr:hypothetical protein AJ78_00478 [Emergomyces pasteurianus Ep9510]